MKNQNELWGRFLQTGKIEDYLNFKIAEKNQMTAYNVEVKTNNNMNINEEYAKMPEY